MEGLTERELMREQLIVTISMIKGEIIALNSHLSDGRINAWVKHVKGLIRAHERMIKRLQAMLDTTLLD